MPSLYYTPSRSLKASPSPKRKSPKRKSPKRNTKNSVNNAIMKFFGSVLGAKVKGAANHSRRSY